MAWHGLGRASPHGCKTAHVAAAELGCQGKSEEQTFHEVGGTVAYQHCSKFQGVAPRPDVFATCRKYHRAGTKRGVQLGRKLIASVLDDEWASILAQHQNEGT